MDTWDEAITDDLVCTPFAVMVKFDCDDWATCFSWLKIPVDVTVCLCCCAAIAFCEENQCFQ